MATRFLRQSVKNLWLITKDDTPTFVIPNSIFGICCAIACARGESQSAIQIFCRLPQVLIFNWTNLLIFDLANQRSPESAIEDKINKPWRPVPSGLLTCDDLRQSMLVAIPTVYCLNAIVLGAGSETAILFSLTWLYNDLKGGDVDWIVRNVIIAFAFGFYNLGSLKVAIANDYEVSSREIWWIVIISLVILTTMHVQDLKDVAGDKLKGRRTLPILIGVKEARWSLITPITLWTAVCAYYWNLGWMSIGSGALAVYLVFRCLRGGDKWFDRKTWQLWCFWTATLYTMPVTLIR